MKKRNFLKKFSELRKSINTRSIYSENKTYKDLVVAFITGKSLGTSVSGRSYYIVGDDKQRFLVYEVIPIAYLQRFGNKIDIQLNANISDSLVGISKVFSYIQSFYTAGNYLIQDQDDINDFFGTVDVHYDIDITPVSFSSIFNEFLLKKDLYNFERFKEFFLKAKDIPKYKKLYDRYYDKVFNDFSDEDYELVDIKTSKVIYSAQEGIEFTQYKDKFKEQISKLVSGDVPANLADKVVSEIKRLPELIISSSEKSLLPELNSDIFKNILEYSEKYGITSYYDYIYNLAKSGVITRGEFPAKTLFESEKENLSDESKVNVLKSILIKLSKAFNELNSSQNSELLQMANATGMINFFTYLDTYDIKDIIDSLVSKSKQQKGLLKDKDGKLGKYIDQIYKFQNAFFNKIKNISLSSLGNKEGIEILMAKNTSKLFDQFNEQLVNSVKEIFDDPSIYESINTIASSYHDLLSKILRTGGEVESSKLDPKESAQKFKALAKSFIISVLSNNINNLYKKNITGTPFQNLIPDILRMHSFAESLSNNDFKANLQNGYLWSGSTFGETELVYSVNGGVIDLPIGFITYKALETKRKHVGEGHILRIEIKDNFIRISLPSFYIGVSKVSDATVMKRIMEMSVQYNRMGQFLNKELVGTLTNKEIQQESLDDNEELEKLIKSGKTIMYLSKEGDLVNFSSYDSKDYFEIQNIIARGLKITDLENFYEKLNDKDLQRKFKKFFLKEDIANAISGYRLWINKTVDEAKKKWDSIDPNDPDFYQKKFNSLTAFQTKESWVIDNTRMVMEMKIGDTGAFSVHSIYSLWNTYTEKRTRDDGTSYEVTKVKKIFTPYFRRYTPNPAYVYAFHNIGLSNAAKDKIESVKNYGTQFKKISKLMSDFNRKNGISYTYEESKGGYQYFPTIFEGDVVSGYTKVIDFIKTNYFQESSVDTIGAGVWVTIDPKVINNEGEEVYRRLVEAQTKVKQQYHQSIVRIVELLQKIHSLNIELSKIVLDFSAKDIDMVDYRKKLFTSIKKEIFEQFKIEMRESVQTALREGILTIESVIGEPGAFTNLENISGENFNPDKALNKFSDSFIQTLKDIVVRITNSNTKINKFKPKEDPAFPEFYKRNLGKFMALNNEIRKYSLELLTLASNYKLKKSTMMDLIKSGRVQNYLQYEQEKFKGNLKKEDEFIGESG